MDTFFHRFLQGKFLKVEVYYDLGGTTDCGMVIARGIYVRVTPVEICNGHQRLILEKELYHNILLKTTKRKDPKALAMAESLLDDLVNLPIEWREEYLVEESKLKDWFNLEAPKSLYDSSSLL